LDKLKSYTDIRFNNFKRYRERLQKVNELKILLRDDDKVSNLGFPVVSKHRDKMTFILRDNDVEIRPLIAGNIVRQPFWQDKSIDLPNCNLIHDYGFYLPNHQNLTFNDVDFICDLITK